jgi:hypothetical protein
VLIASRLGLENKITEIDLQDFSRLLELSGGLGQIDLLELFICYNRAVYAHTARDHLIALY